MQPPCSSGCAEAADQTQPGVASGAAEIGIELVAGSGQDRASVVFHLLGSSAADREQFASGIIQAPPMVSSVLGHAAVLGGVRLHFTAAEERGSGRCGPGPRLHRRRNNT